ncbi:MAG TPA: protein-L-isoaspartate(D-aspartate) O-methyltransferase [Deltaproteobacteria bacterium]|nr:protein-L-isoaspartate(D-aspartate) O-methyltransferase [Deltaproteobacteria bacterium]
MYRRAPSQAAVTALALLGLLCGAGAQGADPYEKVRALMVERQIEARGIKDRRVLEAMATVPRHEFVPETYRDEAYADHPLPIGEGQTISQPYVVALMTELLDLKGGEKVLEIGTGSGYQAAVLAAVTERVYTMEIRAALAKEAAARLERLGYRQVRTRLGDGYYGWPEEAPFDAIIVTAAANHVPPPLLAQLKEGGRLVIPIGSTRYYQTLTRITRVEGEFEVEHVTSVMFVPMVGAAQKQRP